MECKNDYTPQNIKTFIDGVELPLRVWDIDDVNKRVYLTPLDPNFRVDIDSSTGRTFEVQIITSNWTLKQSDSNLLCRSTNQVNRFTHKSIVPGDIDDCVMFTNKTTIIIPPLPPTPFYSIITYQGKRGDIPCDYRFHVSFPTRINEPLPDCKSKCLTEFVEIPSKKIIDLRTDTGVIIPVNSIIPVNCKSGGTNNYLEYSIRKAILDYAKCNSYSFTVRLKPTQKNLNCMKLTLTKSPVTIDKINLGGTLYTFDRRYC